MAERKNSQQPSSRENKKVMMNFNGRDIEATIDETGRIILPEEIQNMLATGVSIIQHATQKAKNEIVDNEPALANDVADKFRGLPMRDLIGSPLIAAAEAQEKLASTAWDFYHRIAYETDDNGNPTDKTRLLKFKLNRPIIEDGVPGNVLEQTVEAPFIGLVPIPSLLIDRIDVDFQMEVTDTNTEKSSSTTEASTSISAKWFTAKVEVAGKVSSARENTRSTNQTAKYQVHVTASQQPQTEGLSKLMDIMAACIEPVPTNGESK